jgi:hypothetical protein
MARAFPSARVVGLDLVPIPLEPEKLPINFEMVVGDINTELPRFQGQFDLVYMRFIFVGVTGQYLFSSLYRPEVDYH